MTDAMRHVRFDPIRAHGAWIYIFLSVAAGSMLKAKHGVEPTLLVGTGFVGAYLLVAALVMGVRRKRKQALVGATLLLAAPLLALALGAETGFLAAAGSASIPAVTAVICARAFGFLSCGAVISGVAALTLAAPTAALAGGAQLDQALLLFGLLAPMFAWRSVRIARQLRRQETWNAAELRSTGLREAALAAIWTILVTFAMK